MSKTKEIMHIAIEWIKKYKIILSSMVISAVVILCAIQLFNHNIETKKFNIAGTQIADMAQNIINHYSTSPSYWGLSTSEVIAKKLYTYDMNIKNGKLIGYFGNNVEVGADSRGSVVMPTSKNFVIAYNSLNKKQCIGLGSHKFNKNFWLKVNKITIKNDNINQDFLWGHKDYELPINGRKLKDLCQDNNNSVIMHF